MKSKDIGNEEDYTTIKKLLDDCSIVSGESYGYNSSSSMWISNNANEVQELHDTIRALRYDIYKLGQIVNDKAIYFEESCDERYAEDWRET